MSSVGSVRRKVEFFPSVLKACSLPSPLPSPVVRKMMAQGDEVKSMGMRWVGWGQRRETVVLKGGKV